MREGAQLAVAKTFDQPHPVFALVRRDVLPNLAAFLERGGRKIDAWYAALGVVEVGFDDEADAFRNINTTASFRRGEGVKVGSDTTFPKIGKIGASAAKVVSDPIFTGDPPMTEPKSLREISCAEDYDPNSMPVDRARELIRTFLVPLTATERVHIRASLGRVLAADVVSPLAVPGHDNSAMDGYAVRFRDLVPDRETVLERVGESFAGKPGGATVGAASACASLPAG